MVEVPSKPFFMGEVDGEDDVKIFFMAGSRRVHPWLRSTIGSSVGGIFMGDSLKILEHIL